MGCGTARPGTSHSGACCTASCLRSSARSEFAPEADDRPLSAGQRLIRRALAIQVVTFLWIPLRAQGLNVVGMLLGQMFAFNGAPAVTNGFASAIVAILVSSVWQAIAELTSVEERLLNAWIPVNAAAYSAVIVAVLIASSAPPRAFIYFQF